MKMSLKFISNGLNNNIPALVQMMAKQQVIIWTNDSKITDAYMRHTTSMS